MMSSRASPIVWPWECRDLQDEAEVVYNNPLRRANQSLADENMRLKRLLRKNGISWSQVALNHMKQHEPGALRKTRSSTALQGLGLPFLPMEILLRILMFAVKSPHPIIDPLAPLTSENLTLEEYSRGNQVAIHFLATCKSMHLEGTRYFWESNSFTFTTPQAIRNFADLPFKFRESIRDVNFRVVARYYDDQKSRKHRLERSYHPDLKKDELLRVQLRPKETPLIRGGFRCYTWNHIIDFLEGLRAPFDPTRRSKKQRWPMLLPNLATLRLDLVNFSDVLLPFSGPELHEITSHELGCTLNELQITGMPSDETGQRASKELSGMLKDEGLYLDAASCYVATGKYLQPLTGYSWVPKVVRAWSVNADAENDHLPPIHAEPILGKLPPAPREEGHPISKCPEALIIWRRVPVARDAIDREWIQFSRHDGYEMDEEELDSDGEGLCPCCREVHSSSLLNDMDDSSLLDDPPFDEEMLDLL
ncbi:hypothetical protein G7046_g5764 [Stylonectria norvegica]|nr:hypothetical protein G7046_g5764 [Stylonectria norvegica]